MEGEMLRNVELNGKGFVSDEVRTQLFRKLRSKPENRVCFDCSGRNPTWLSLSHAVYLCLECSGDHRRMGVHISFVRSVELDSFTPEQLCRLIGGGNRSAQEFFKAHGVISKRKDPNPGKQVNYFEKLAAKHRQQVEKNGQTLYEELDLAAGATGATVSVPKASSPVASSMQSDFFQEMLRNSNSNLGSAECSAPIPVHVTVPIPQSTPSVPSDNPALRRFSAGSGSKNTQPQKPKAKELDFDFDFDEAERIANIPAPAPIHKPAEQAVLKPAQSLNFQPYGAPSVPACIANQEETPAMKGTQDRLNQFHGTSAISSGAFFGSVTPPKRDVSESVENLRFAAREVAERASEKLSFGLAKGKEWVSSLPSYLAKAQN